MTTTYRKKLIEVSLPLAAINSESAREKSIRHGHPSTLHLWWARRPLAACRAVLFSSLVDDPDSDPQYRRPDGSVDEDSAGLKRADLFNLIEELVAWENSNNPEVIRSARAEIARCVASRKIELEELAPDYELTPGNGKVPKVTVQDLVTKGHCRPQAMGLDKKAGRVRFSFDVSQLPSAEVVNAFLAEHAPPVLDPFAGGGSIPLEAQRLGLRAYASDLNPVPVLINKALIEIPPKFAGRPPVNPESRGEGSGKGKGKGQKTKALIEQDWPGATGLAEDVRYYGKWMRDEAEKRIGHLYPKVEITEEIVKDRPDLKDYVGQKLTVIAWLWARTVASPNPVCGGAHVPLVSSFQLSTKATNRAWIEPIVDRDAGSYRFQVKTSGDGPSRGTVSKRQGDLCLLSGSPMTREYIRSEGNARRFGLRLLAIVAEGKRGRVYLSPSETHEATALRIPQRTDLPDSPITGDTRYLTPTTYGMTHFADLFTCRQATALATFSTILDEVRTKVSDDSGNNKEYGDAIATYLAFACDRAADAWSNLASWRPTVGATRSTFSRQALSMVWDFAEANPFSEACGNWNDACLGWIVKAIENVPASGLGVVDQRDATTVLPVCPVVFSTDPPYYDNVPYSDLSDYFYIWLRRNLAQVYPTLLSTVLTPKSQELVADPYRQGGREQAQHFFESGMSRALSQMLKSSDSDYPATIYYAFKQTEDDDDDDSGEMGSAVPTSTGWETFLQGLGDVGWQINGTWPVRTEKVGRTRELGSNALASSIVLVCRPRAKNAPLATRKEFLTALRRELPDALRNLQQGNIAPVDLAQSAIGPGMAVFTRYAKVLESDGSSMSVRTALGLINQTLDEVLAEQEGEFDGDTRWAISWFEQFGVEEGPFGDAETLSKAKNTAVNGLVEAGIIVARSGRVRLIRRDELPKDWNPATDKRLTVWEITQHLIHRLDEQGEIGAAQLVAQLGSVGEVARDLAYRLYSTCERKKWAQEAMAYNTLVVAWPELTKLALSNRPRQESIQPELF